MKIPKQIYYIFGLNETFCDRPFCYFHYLNIKSASVVNPDYNITVYYKYKSTDVYFDKLNEFCKLVKLDTIPTHINNIKFNYYEHIGDYLRLKNIYENGGIYLDIDTVCVKSFDNLLEYDCVMGIESGVQIGDIEPTVIGLCNATFLGTKHNKFMKLWIDDYNTNYKIDWNYNSVKRPYALSKEHISLIKILNRNSFFKYSWDVDGKNKLFYMNSDVSDCYSLHLWESKFFNILQTYTPDVINNTDNTVCNLYKTLI